mgnify:CR=1 FL=1
MRNISVTKANPVETRKQLEIVNAMVKHGMRFVAVPVLGDDDFLYLASIVKVRIAQLEKAAEEGENENGKG